MGQKFIPCCPEVQPQLSRSRQMMCSWQRQRHQPAVLETKKQNLLLGITVNLRTISAACRWYSKKCLPCQPDGSPHICLAWLLRIKGKKGLSSEGNPVDLSKNNFAFLWLKSTFEYTLKSAWRRKTSRVPSGAKLWSRINILLTTYGLWASVILMARKMWNIFSKKAITITSYVLNSGRLNPISCLRCERSWHENSVDIVGGQSALVL